MTTPPAVSVVIPTYNRGRLLVQSVASVLAQTVPAAEILVIDDGSTDDTAQRLAPYLDRVRYLPQRNQGVSAARNHGVRAATGALLAFLDSDDVWHPRKLELQLRVFERQLELGMLGTHSFAWPAAAFPAVNGERVTNVSWEQLAVRNYLVTSSILARREVLERAGPFDTGLQGPEDRDLWLRVAALAPVANLELPLTGYRQVAGSLSKQAVACQTGMLKILRKLDDSDAWRGRRLLRRKAYSYVNHSCAYLHGAAGNYPTSLLNSLRSLAWYPLPYRREEVDIAAERPRRMLVNLLRWLGLKPAEPPSVAAEEADDALALFTPHQPLLETAQR